MDFERRQMQNIRAMHQHTYVCNKNIVDMNFTFRTKLCKDCKHFKSKETQAQCTLFMNIDLIDGSTEPCNVDIMRYNVDYCGPGGKYFESK